MAFDTTKETMVSFLFPSQILETIDDIRDFEGNPSRSFIIRRLLNRELKSYFDSDTQQRYLHKNQYNKQLSNCRNISTYYPQKFLIL
jgi:metal-responsive CopG/Arc/MetJ family transcriptional regulator